FGAVVLVTLAVLGVPFAILLGIWVALVAMVPLVGGVIAGVPTVIIALFHSPSAALVVLLVFIGFQLIENHFLYPIVMSRTVRMNPLWVLLAVLVGANLGGIFGSALGALAGAIVAIPVSGALQVVFSEVWVKTRSGPMGTKLDGGAPAGEGAGPGRPDQSNMVGNGGSQGAVRGNRRPVP
ncbi:MAG: AI-2E family transporter, partial [Acidimicrobiales bacterium]